MTGNGHRSIIRERLGESAATKQRTIESCTEQIEQAATLMAACFEAGGRVFLCGNGGSAADCQHIAAEFTSVLRRDFPRRALAAIALTTDTSFLTANANDFGFEGIFARQIEALGREGDVLIGISTSGSSRNVLLAVDTARQRGLRTIALAGSAGPLAAAVDVPISVPSTTTSHIQETHIAIGHILCEIVENILFRDGSAQ